VEYWPVDPGFKGAQVRHEHQWEPGVADFNEVSDRFRLKERVGEERLVVLQTQMGNEGQPAEEEAAAGREGVVPKNDRSGEPGH